LQTRNIYEKNIKANIFLLICCRKATRTTKTK